jgi:hypothetical protein
MECQPSRGELLFTNRYHLQSSRLLGTLLQSPATFFGGTLLKGYTFLLTLPLRLEEGKACSGSLHCEAAAKFTCRGVIAGVDCIVGGHHEL